MTVNIYEYGSKIKEEITKFLKTAGVESYELTDEIKRTKERNADFRAWAGDKEGWYEFITHAEDIEAIDRVKDTCFKVINMISKQKREEKTEEEKKNTEWWKENSNYWQESNNWWKKYKNNELDWQKDQKKRDEENKKKLEESEKNRENDEKKENEEWKKKFIGDIEMDLIKKNVSGEQLSKRLGVSDWKEKINGAADFHEALSRRSDLWDIIRELKSKSKNEFTCASYGEKKEEYYKYPLEGGKKYCSAECWNKGEKKEEDNNDSPRQNSHRGDNFGFSSVSEFFTWMKKMGVEKIEFDFNTNQVIISCNGGKKLNASDSKSGLTTKQQQALAERFKSETKPITFSQIQSELEKGSKDKSGNGGIIAAIVVVGVLLAVIVGVVVYNRNKKRDY